MEMRLLNSCYNSSLGNPIGSYDMREKKVQERNVVRLFSQICCKRLFQKSAVKDCFQESAVKVVLGICWKDCLLTDREF
jgi:hypothetical protein